MRRFLIFLVLGGMALSMSGCIVAVGNKGSKRDVGNGDCVSAADFGECAVVIAEIEAIGKLHMDSSKTNRYAAIAARENLACGAQGKLVNAVFSKLHMESSKQRVLLALIENRCFCTAGKMAILKRLSKLHMESNKEQILSVLNERGELKNCEEEVEVVEEGGSSV